MWCIVDICAGNVYAMGDAGIVLGTGLTPSLSFDFVHTLSLLFSFDLAPQAPYAGSWIVCHFLTSAFCV